MTDDDLDAEPELDAEEEPGDVELEQAADSAADLASSVGRAELDDLPELDLDSLHIEPPSVREHLTRDWRWWTAFAATLLAASCVAFAIKAYARDEVLTEATAEQTVLIRAQTEALACRSRSAAEVEQADARLAIGIADFVTAQVNDDPDAVARSAADIAAAAIELRGAADEREAELEQCIEIAANGSNGG